MVKHFFTAIPSRYQQSFNQALITTNVERIRVLSLGFMGIGILLLVLDSQMLQTQADPGLHRFYLWTDAALLFLGALIYLFFTRVANRLLPGSTQLYMATICVCVVMMTWCGVVSAIEYFTHQSVTTLILGALIVACGVYVRGWVICLSYAAGITALVLFEKIIGPEPVHFLSEHTALISLSLLGVLLSRILYVNKADNFLFQQQIVENNQQLANEIEIRKHTQDKLNKAQKVLEQRVFERTQELFLANEELKNEMMQRQKVQEKLNQSQKMEVIGTLAGGIAHDFNNILFPIVGHTEMLLEEMEQDSLLRPSVNEI